MHALVHVGATQRVTYMGEDMIYYFLVKYADPTIVPDIHSVMYYDLFEDAGGAYHHDDFSEHRQYLLERMCARRAGRVSPGGRVLGRVRQLGAAVRSAVRAQPAGSISTGSRRPAAARSTST